MIPTIAKLLPGRKEGSDGVNAYLTKCKIAALGRERKRRASRLVRGRSVAEQGYSDWPPVEHVAQTFSRAKALIGIAAGLCLVLAVYVATIWPHRGTVLATKNFQSYSEASRQVVAPLESTDEIVEALANIEDVDLDAGPVNLRERREPPRDLAATGLPALKALAGQDAREAVSVSMDNVQLDVPEVPVRVDGETALVPPVQVRHQEARATAIDTAIELPMTQPAPPAESAAALLRQGHRLLEIGDIKAARDLFEEMAAEGIAAGAIALGSTYDAKSLADSGMTNITPDPDKALLWYRHAHLLAEAAAKRKGYSERD